MIDFAAFTLAVALCTTLGLVLWRRVRGAANSPLAKLGRSATCLVLSITLVGLASWRLSNARTVQVMGEIVPRVETADSAVAITFDDGPYPGATQQVLAMLARHQVRATFFLNGDAIARHPAAARAIVEAGHEVGNHSFSHAMLMGRSLRRIREEIERTDDQIRAVGYAGEIHFRSPYGKKYVALPYYLARTGRKNIFWDVEPDSYAAVARDSALIVAHVRERVRPGSIILLHVMTRHYEPSRRAVPAIIQELEAQGYRFVTVSELLDRDAGSPRGQQPSAPRP